MSRADVGRYEGYREPGMNIFSLVQKNKKGLVVCVNKWDLIEDKSQKVIDSYTTAIRERLAPFTDFPILFISALTKQRILKVLETAKEVYENRSKRVPTAKLNEVMLPIIENYPPPAWKGKYIKIKYITQLPAGSVPFSCSSVTCRNGSRTRTNVSLRTRYARTGILPVRRLIYLSGKSKYIVTYMRDAWPSFVEVRRFLCCVFGLIGIFGALSN